MLSTLREDKATGADGLNPKYLKAIQIEICYPLWVIYKKSLWECSIPDDWKLTNICPIFKKGDRSLIENYRPVSLTSQLGKLCEGIVKDAIVTHLEKFGLVRDTQHGFRRGGSCVSNVLIFLDKITRWIDVGHPADVIFLDFAKAFDKVPHKRLITKMKMYGIDGKI